MIVVREERPQDIEATRMIYEQAFEKSTEADIVDKLRKSCQGLLALVAEDGDRILGHILFSPAHIEGGIKTVEGMGLAPVAVLSKLQRQGIGSLLIQAGISILKNRGCPFIIVLGHPEYYPRFGFEQASRSGIRCRWVGVPEEAFMILILDREEMSGVEGVARYSREFEEVKDS